MEMYCDQDHPMYPDQTSRSYQVILNKSMKIVKQKHFVRKHALFWPEENSVLYHIN